MIKVLIDTSPLASAHAIRGIGTYTRLLVENLQALAAIEVKKSTALDSNSNFKPDLTHYPYFDLFFSTLPVKPLAKTVVTIHDLIPLRFPEHYPPGVKGSLRFKKQKLALKTVKAIITDSFASKQDIIDYLQVPAEKIHVVYLAGNPQVKHLTVNQVEPVLDKYHLPSDYLLYVGDINYNKNIPQLIKSLKYLPETMHLVLLGKNFTKQDIPEWNWIESQIAMSEVEDRVHFLDQILGDADLELSAIYSSAQVYVQPSLFEGFGLPVLEAMQAKTPVVCAQNSSLIEVGGESVVFTKSEAESLAQGVKKVLAWTQQEKQERINQAYNWSQTFSWAKAAQETLKVYQQVVSS